MVGNVLLTVTLFEVNIELVMVAVVSYIYSAPPALVAELEVNVEAEISAVTL